MILPHEQKEKMRFFFFFFLGHSWQGLGVCLSLAQCLRDVEMLGFDEVLSHLHAQHALSLRKCLPVLRKQVMRVEGLS